jgi:hypothetical protein
MRRTGKRGLRLPRDALLREQERVADDADADADANQHRENNNNNNKQTKQQHQQAPIS